MPKRTAPLYSSRLFTEEDEGRTWLARILSKSKATYPDHEFELSAEWKTVHGNRLFNASIRKID